MSLPLPKELLALGGTHILAEIYTRDSDKLLSYFATKEFLQRTLERVGVTEIGNVYHNFPGGGFTCVICLAESHISIHTWPEKQFLTMDVYLCNYKRDNSHLASDIADSIKEFFEPKDISSRVIYR